MRRPLIGPLFAMSVLGLVALPITAQPTSSPSRSAVPGWEYGALEKVPTDLGTTYVFCRFTAAGCLEEMAFDQTSMRTEHRAREARLGQIDAVAARAVSRLGRDGWELVAESAFAAGTGEPPALLFKRNRLR